MKTLVLNADYTFLGICSPETAVCGWYTGKCIVEETYDTEWHSASLTIRVPAVIRLKKYVKILYQRLTYVSYNKRNVHLRDKYICQYCGIKLDRYKSSIDHILPRSRGGLSTWENTVTACHGCNLIKEDRTLQESGLRLIKIPSKPHGFKEIIRIKVGEIVWLWEKYLT